jgi:hypothetical protein
MRSKISFSCIYFVANYKSRTTRNVKLCAKITYGMEDSEPETIVIKDWHEKFSDILSVIGVNSTPNKIGEGEVEKGDYYSRCFSQTTRMVTNKGSLKISGTNIDAVQIIQKG